MKPKPLKILVMGLPGSGKTVLSKKLQERLNCAYYNADEIRKAANDWDFTAQGRIRQALRMRMMAEFENNQAGSSCICDFVCPTNMTRSMFNADFIVYLETIGEGRYEDTNKVFERPKNEDISVLVTTQDADYWVDIIVKQLGVE